MILFCGGGESLRGDRGGEFGANVMLGEGWRMRCWDVDGGSGWDDDCARVVGKDRGSGEVVFS